MSKTETRHQPILQNAHHPCGRITQHHTFIWADGRERVCLGVPHQTTTQRAAGLITSGHVAADRFVTHHFDLDDFVEAYDVFGRAAGTGRVLIHEDYQAKKGGPGSLVGVYHDRYQRIGHTWLFAERRIEIFRRD